MLEDTVAEVYVLAIHEIILAEQSHLFQSLAATYEISGAALRGLGRPMVPALLTVFGSCVFRILWIWTVFRVFPELRVLFSVYPASWILTGLLVTSAYLFCSKVPLP